MAFRRDDYMSIQEIADDWGFSHDTALRWLKKYADKDAVEVHGGKYYAHKDEVHRWKAAYERNYMPMKLAQVPFKKLSELVAAERPFVPVSKFFASIPDE